MTLLCVFKYKTLWGSSLSSQPSILRICWLSSVCWEVYEVCCLLFLASVVEIDVQVVHSHPSNQYSESSPEDLVDWQSDCACPAVNTVWWQVCHHRHTEPSTRAAAQQRRMPLNSLFLPVLSLTHFSCDYKMYPRKGYLLSRWFVIFENFGTWGLPGRHTHPSF